MVRKFPNIHLIEVKNLHSKVYLNDNKCILTSMNFYEYSQINNFEIGVIIDRKEEKANFNGIIDQIILMTKLSNNNTVLLKELELFSDYSVGMLFTEIKKITSKNTLRNYESFCIELRKITEIKTHELYEDGTAILRRTNLGKDRYLKVYNFLK